jgi:hypothetical protein
VLAVSVIDAGALVDAAEGDLGLQIHEGDLSKTKNHARVG